MNRKTSREKELSKRREKPSTYRRVVTENVNGKAVVQNDECCWPTSSRLSPVTSIRLLGSTRRCQTLARSKGLTAIPTRSFRDLAAQVFTS